MDFFLLFLCFAIWFSISETINLLIKNEPIIYVCVGIEVLVPNHLILLETFGLQTVIVSLILEKVFLSKKNIDQNGL